MHLRFERVQTRQQRQDEDVLPLVREGLLVRWIGPGISAMLKKALWNN